MTEALERKVLVAECCDKLVDRLPEIIGDEAAYKTMLDEMGKEYGVDVVEEAMRTLLPAMESLGGGKRH